MKDLNLRKDMLIFQMLSYYHLIKRHINVFVKESMENFTEENKTSLLRLKAFMLNDMNIIQCFGATADLVVFFCPSRGELHLEFG